jgi:hypothetical protein
MIKNQIIDSKKYLLYSKFLVIVCFIFKLIKYSDSKKYYPPPHHFENPPHPNELIQDDFDDESDDDHDELEPQDEPQ